MKRYPISKEYVKELNEHQYVEHATQWTVSFTPEFKQLAYDEIYRGKSMREIFTEGIHSEAQGQRFHTVHVTPGKLLGQCSAGELLRSYER